MAEYLALMFGIFCFEMRFALWNLPVYKDCNGETRHRKLIIAARAQFAEATISLVVLKYYLKQKYPGDAMFAPQFEMNSIVSLKEAIKWSLITPLESRLAAKFDANALSRIALLYKHVPSLTELSFIKHAGGDAKRRRYGYEEKAPLAGLAVVAAALAAEAGDSVAAVTRALASMTSVDFLRHCSSPPSQLKIPCEYSVMCYHMPVFVGGRYLKLARNVSQSRWLIDDERMGEGSVQEVIGNVVFPYYKGDSPKFDAAGREDIDVRMLGSGRPS